MGITIKDTKHSEHTKTQNLKIYSTLKYKPLKTPNMQKQLTNQVRSSHKLFRTAKMSERRSHQSIKEAECLKQRPVKDFATWYEKGIDGKTKVFLQKIACGSTSEISLCEQYPNRLPEEFRLMDVKTLREYLLRLKLD